MAMTQEWRVHAAYGPEGTNEINMVDLVLAYMDYGEESLHTFTIPLLAPLVDDGQLTDADIIFAASQQVASEKIQEIETFAQEDLQFKRLRTENAAVIRGEDPAAIVPASITMRQARLVLAQQGLLTAVDTAIASLPEPDRTNVSIEWEYSAVVERASPWLGSMGAALGLTESDLDNLFLLGKTL